MQSVIQHELVSGWFFPSNISSRYVTLQFFNHTHSPKLSNTFCRSLGLFWLQKLWFVFVTSYWEPLHPPGVETLGIPWVRLLSDKNNEPDAWNECIGTRDNGHQLYWWEAQYRSSGTRLFPILRLKPNLPTGHSMLAFTPPVLLRPLLQTWLCRRRKRPKRSLLQISCDGVHDDNGEKLWRVAPWCTPTEMENPADVLASSYLPFTGLDPDPLDKLFMDGVNSQHVPITKCGKWTRASSKWWKAGCDGFGYSLCFSMIIWTEWMTSVVSQLATSPHWLVGFFEFGGR